MILNEGIQVQEVRSCFLCKVEGIPIYNDMRDRLFNAPGTWNMTRCPQCGFVWLNPRPISKEIHKLYSTYYTHIPGNAPSRRRNSLRKTINRSILATAYGYDNISINNVGKTSSQLLSSIGILRDVVGRKIMWLSASRRGRLLDVGCGNGQFLSRMRNMGWDVVGVEPNLKAARVGRKRFGLKIFQTTLGEANLPSAQFDAVTMNNVIEHVQDPISSIKECRRVLRKGGQFVMITPNINSIGHRLFKKSWRGLEVPRHFQLFSPWTLRICNELAKMKVQSIKTIAVAARDIWYESRFVKRNSLDHECIKTRLSLRLRLEAHQFWILEHLLLKFRPYGEEIVMVATKE